MKKLLFRTSISLVIILILTAGAGWWYIEKVFLPTKLEPMVIETLQNKAGIKIAIGDIFYIFPREFIIKGFTLFEKEIPSQKFLTVKEIDIRFRPMALLVKKQVIINKIDLKTLQIYPGPGHTFISKGHIFIDGEFSYKLNDPESLTYNAVLNLKDQDIKNMPFVKDIAQLNGRIKIVPEKISIIELKGISFGCPVEFAGFLENFKDPYLDLTENIDLDLSKINKFLSEKVSKAIKPITLSGRSAAMLHMSGKFSEWPLKFNGSAKVANAEAKIQNMANPILSISANAVFDENSVSIPDLSAQYNNIYYNFKANLTNFNAPSIYAVLTSQDFLLETKIRTIDDYIRFDTLDANWFNSNIQLVGEIQSYQKPELKLSGEAQIDLEDIQKILVRIQGPNEKFSAFMNNLRPKGKCAVSLFIDGMLHDFANCEIGIKAGSENLSLSGFNLGVLDMSMQVKNKLLTVPKMDLNPYGGVLKLEGKFNFAPTDKTTANEYNVEIKGANIDLSKLIKDTGFKDKTIWGNSFFSCSLNGVSNDLGKLNGQGWIMVSDGHLWEFPLLGGLADLLSLHQLKNVEIKEVAGNFTVQDKKIATDNLEFTSPQMNMQARGSLGLEGALDFNIGLSVARDFAQQNELTKLAMIIVDETGRFLGQIKLSGTLKEPKYAFVPFHLDKIFDNKVINKIKEIFKKPQ